jgi:hypothetical protein
MGLARRRGAGIDINWLPIPIPSILANQKQLATGIRWFLEIQTALKRFRDVKI